MSGLTRAGEVPGQLLVTLRFGVRVAALAAPRGPRRSHKERIVSLGWKELDGILKKVGGRSISRIHHAFPHWSLRHERWGSLRRKMDSTFLVVYDHQKVSARTALSYFANCGTVLTAQPNYFLQPLSPAPVPAGAMPWFDAIDMNDAWAITRGDPSVTVAVIDSGITRNHPEFRPELLRIEPGCDVVDCVGLNPPIGHWLNDSMYPDDDPTDDFGHGTYIAGLVGGATRGTSPECKILPVRALATAASEESSTLNAYGKADDLARAIRFAVDHGARVLNLSYGNAAADQPGSNSPERHAVEDAIKHGCFLAAAMGNGGDVGSPMYPAAYKDVCGVAAIDNDGKTRWPSSQTGSHCDLSAPGVSIESASMSGGFEVRSGTSNSTAVVSGVAALMLSACASRKKPQPPGVQLGRMLTGTAEHLGPGASPTLEFGYGRINPRAAIAAALGTGPV